MLKCLDFRERVFQVTWQQRIYKNATLVAQSFAFHLPISTS